MVFQLYTKYFKKNKNATTVIKNELKYTPVSEGSTCIAEPNLRGITLKNNAQSGHYSYNQNKTNHIINFNESVSNFSQVLSLIS